MKEMDLSSMTLAKLIREQPEFVEDRIRFLLDERKMLQKGLMRAHRSLLYVARTCVENPVVAEYARRASLDLPIDEPLQKEERGLDEEGV